MKLTSVLPLLFGNTVRIQAYQLSGHTGPTPPANLFNATNADKCDVNEMQCAPDDIDTQHLDSDEADINDAPVLQSKVKDYS